MSIVKLNNNGIKNVTTLGSVSLGNMVFIKKLTASSSGTLSFVDGASSVVLDSTYKEYLFTFKDIHGSQDVTDLTFQTSTNTGSSYGVTATTTNFLVYNNESTGDAGTLYNTASDLAQSTNFAQLSQDMGADNDQSAAGYLHLFNPSSTTFVKNFISRSHTNRSSNGAFSAFVGGYCNVTAAIDGVQFAMSSGNIDSGTIKLYGIKDS